MNSPDAFNPGFAASTGPSSESVQLRSLASPEDYRACIALQREVWGDDFQELVPASFVKVSRKIGGVAAGAFDADNHLLGFVFGMTGVEHGEPVHWSHMLAVREGARNRGIGRRLKFFQYRTLYSLGVELMYWTFDPLVARNAHFNLNRLGAKVREYVPNMYGETGSKLHKHGTDRLVVVWRLSDPAVLETLAGSEAARDIPAIDGAPVVNALMGDDGMPRPLEREPRDSSVVLIEIPDSPLVSESNHGPAAVQWRAAIRRSFVGYLARGYSVAGFHSRADDGRSFYILTERAV